MTIQLYKRLFRFLIPYKKQLALAILFSVIVGVIASSPVPLIQKTFDDIFVEKDFFMLKVIPLALVFRILPAATATFQPVDRVHVLCFMLLAAATATFRKSQ